MASVSPGAVLGACAAAAAIACGGAALTDLSQANSLLKTALTGVTSAPPSASAQDAVRLAKQATFGPDQATVDAITNMGTEKWVDAQLNARSSTYADLAALSVPRNQCNGLTGTPLNDCNRTYFSATYPAMRFYANAVHGDDQLRQRVALALSQTLVASANSIANTSAVATLNQIFLDNAFGNYRDILKQVTLNGMMGGWLNMADSNKTAPNENYARELMQLFAIGVNQMNMDGTDKLDASGAPIPTYTGTDVKEVARALTGWTYARLNNAAVTDNNSVDYAKPMIKVPARFDTGSKFFLATNIAANATQDANVEAVVDAMFNHDNTPPFVAKMLIKQLVTSNPSPAYVERVARVFAGKSGAARGDMKATVRAVLLDPEARGDTKGGDFGKVKEPILLLTSLGRVIGERTDGFVYQSRDATLGQPIFKAPSVFNYYPPDYPLPLSNGLQSGPSKLINTGSAIARHNFVYDWTVSGDQASRSEYNVQAIPNASGTQVDWTYWETLGANPDNVIAKIDALMLGGSMTTAQKAAMKTAMMAITNTNAATQARKRAQVALYIAATSPQFQVDR